MLRGLKKSIARMAAVVFDRWLTRLTPGERIYVLEKLSRAVMSHLIHAKEADLRPGTPRGRLRVLKDHLAHELDQLSRADQVDLFRAAAILVGMDSYCVTGPLGVFQGNSHDSVVLARYATNGTWDPAYQALLKNHLFREKRGTLIDIGANIGLTSIPIARERQIACYAFEPEPSNYLHLRQNVLANGVESFVNCFNFALFSAEGFVTLELARENLGDHRVRSEGFKNRAVAHLFEEEDERQTVQVRATTLDAFFQGRSLAAPIVVKNDTQGSEVQVLMGASELLPHVDYLVTEFEPYLLDRIGDSADAYIALIGQFPYGALQENPDDPARMALDVPPRLEPIESVSERLRAFSIRASGPDDYANVILSRYPEIASR